MCLFVIGHNLNPHKILYWYFLVRVRNIVFNATFNNISVISWRSFYCWRKPEYPEKTTDLPQVEFELYNKCIKCYDYL